MAASLRDDIRANAPELTAGIDRLCSVWLQPLLEQLGNQAFRPKQINDAVWGTVDLLPWEVALLDAPLVQRMRGVRQLGLAHLVFPGAVHDRLEHLIGVVGAVEMMLGGIERQIERWNRDPRNRSNNLPVIKSEHRHRLRLAAIFHDLGHGPFSHAIEPVLEITSPLGTSTIQPSGAWRSEIPAVRGTLQNRYSLNGSPSVSEVVAVMIIMSGAVQQALASDALITERWAAAPELQEQLVACVIGAIDGPGADHLSALISSQLDADRMDYLTRDAHHAGLTIGFDTARLLSRLEILQMRDDNTPHADEATRARIASEKPHPVLQIGIAASGFGSFEQMLIGRTFLYDRLYHHHKVRSAEAMAQRMLLVAERDRGSRLGLDEIFLSVGDDTFIRILAEEVSHPQFATKSPPASRLARNLLNRRLLHRAYAFRARFVATPPGLDSQSAETTRNEQWRRLLKDLETLGQRYDVGVAIHDVAVRAAEALVNADVEKVTTERYLKDLRESGPEQIIVDVPVRKADAIRIMARYPDGALKVPEFSFNPVKWADAYDLQKRTGYVFCPRNLVPIIAVSSAIVFMVRYGVIMGADAQGYIKADSALDARWASVLVSAGILDQDAADQLQSKRHSLLALRLEDLRVPSEWVKEAPNFAVQLIAGVKAGLRSGLTSEALSSFSKVMDAMFRFVNYWHERRITENIASEAELQSELADFFTKAAIGFQEGTVVGGGKLDLYAENTVLIENKFQSAPAANPESVAPSAGIQGRRYAIALLSQIVLTVVAVKHKPGKVVPQRSDCVQVLQPNTGDGNRVEIRFTLPFGAPVPSASTNFC